MDKKAKACSRHIKGIEERISQVNGARLPVSIGRCYFYSGDIADLQLFQPD